MYKGSNAVVDTQIDLDVDAYVEYSSNNSGGSWWLTDADWVALEKAGWIVDWVKDREGESARWLDKDDPTRTLGALATYACLKTDNLREAIRSWEAAVDQQASALGCSCCGPPHYFSQRKGKEWGDSYSPESPEYGEDY